ncbi:MAG: acylphosphatase [Planctomycetaceae bacterium]
MTRQIFFSGRVQGVGFRYTTRQIARRFPVTGYVRNLADGRVEVIVQGEAEDLDQFQGAVESHFTGNITDVAVSEMDTVEQFSVFAIRH